MRVTQVKCLKAFWSLAASWLTGKEKRSACTAGVRAALVEFDPVLCHSPLHQRAWFFFLVHSLHPVCLSQLVAVGSVQGNRHIAMTTTHQNNLDLQAFLYKQKQCRKEKIKKKTKSVWFLMSDRLALWDFMASGNCRRDRARACAEGQAGEAADVK